MECKEVETVVFTLSKGDCHLGKSLATTPELVSQQFQEVCSYFDREKTIRQLIPLCTGVGWTGATPRKISGRMVDYLMTAYCRKELCEVEGRNIQSLYIQGMRSVGGRILFDPCKREKYGFAVSFHHPLTGESCTSSLAQMNYVRWLFSSGVFQFLVDHYQEINHDQQATSKRIHQEKKSLAQVGIKRKRQSLSSEPKGQGFSICHDPFVVLFE